MTLADIWFLLFIVIIGGYLILDGFDIGVGILHPFLARTDEERRVMLNSIGPVWDGNEVWLILGGGALFAAFPLVYASLFSGFYWAMMLVLVTLILRAVAIEFRSKEPGRRWRSGWDWVFCLSSAGLALLLGVAFGNIVIGVPLDADGNIQSTLVDLLGVVPLLIGLTALLMFATHGAIYLTLKAEGDLLARIRAAVPRLQGAFVALLLVSFVAMVVTGPAGTLKYREQLWPAIVPLAALGTLAGSWRMVRAGRDLRAFVLSGATIALLLVAGAIGMYPDLLISTIDPAYNLTVANGASADNTLTVMLVVALIGMPFVLLYTAGVYWIFRGRTVVEPHGY